jgi:hypothetical protein
MSMTTALSHFDQISGAAEERKGSNSRRGAIKPRIKVTGRREDSIYGYRHREH